MRLTLASVVVIALSAAACRKTTVSLSRAAPSASAAASVAESPMEPDAGPTETIGRPPHPLPAETAVKENDAGFKAHQKGAFPDSRAAFARAVAIDPDFTMARYNLACAYARLGALDEAERELSRALREDLPSFRRGLEKDADLEALRASAAHIGRLRALVGRLETQYRAAMTHGLRVLLWARSKASRWGSNADQRVIGQAGALQVGVYDASTKRFVPIAPAAKKPLTALWNRDTKLAAVLGGDWNPFCGGDLCQWIESPFLEIYDDSLSGTPVATIPTKGQAGGVHATITGGTVTFEVFRAFEPKPEDNGTFVHTWTAAGGTKVKRFGPEGDRSSLPSPPFSYVDAAERMGNFTVHDEGGVTWDKKTRTLKLVKGGDSVTLTDVPSTTTAPRSVLSPNGRRALLLWSQDRECPGPDDTLTQTRHAVLLVDFDEKRAMTLSDGVKSRLPGSGDVAFDGDGEGYVQFRDHLTHVGPEGAYEPIDDGMVLSPPTLEGWACMGFW